MQNHFFGDINDYYKYGLLRLLSGFGQKKIGVCWMLRPDDAPKLGQKTHYLDDPHTWRRYDPDLFDCLRKSVKDDGDRNVKRLEASNLLPSATFYSEILTDPGMQRQSYFTEVYRRFSGVDLIFFDPDTGLEVKRPKIGNKDSSKFLYWHEVAKAFQRGHSLLIIQFFLGVTAGAISEKVRALSEATQAQRIYVFRAGGVVFFLCAQKEHFGFFDDQREQVASIWKPLQLSLFPNAAESVEALEEPTDTQDGQKTTESVYPLRPLKLDQVRTYALASRRSKVSVQDFAHAVRSGASVKALLDSMPRILAGEDFRAVVRAIRRARKKRKPIIWGLGGHVIKCGLAPVLIDLMRRGFLTAAAMNGSAMIHDFEIGLVGSTSEDVPAVLGCGQFGMAEETGRYIHQAIVEGDQEQLGIGEAVGRCLARHRDARFRKYSLLAAAYTERAPVTVHVAIGTDIIHNHPAIDARALGAATHRDFLLLAALVKDMDGGGVYLNVGSAVVLPEVFLKCVSLAANLGHAPRGITTVNMDFIQHYRPTQNVLLRPIAAGSSEPGKGRGYPLTGHHEIMIPLLAAALKSSNG
jgi:hypothetical protein